MGHSCTACALDTLPLDESRKVWDEIYSDPSHPYHAKEMLAKQATSLEDYVRALYMTDYYRVISQHVHPNMDPERPGNIFYHDCDKEDCIYLKESKIEYCPKGWITIIATPACESGWVVFSD